MQKHKSPPKHFSPPKLSHDPYSAQLQQQKSLTNWSGLLFVFDGSLLGQRRYADERLALTLLAERYRTVYQCEEGVILTHTHVLAGVVDSTSLTNDDVASLSELTTEKFYAESLALRLTAVLRRTYTFFVCHVSLIF